MDIFLEIKINYNNEKYSEIKMWPSDVTMNTILIAYNNLIIAESKSSKLGFDVTHDSWLDVKNKL